VRVRVKTPDADHLKTPDADHLKTPDADHLLRQWYGAARFTYNQCVAGVRYGIAKPELGELRSWCVNRYSPALAEWPWLAETPYDVRDEAVRDFVKAYWTNVKKGGPFEMHFRTRRDKQQSIVFHKKHWANASGVFAKVRAGLAPREPLPAELPSDARLTRDRLGKTHLRWAVPLDVRDAASAPREDTDATIALDPGVRTFMTGYDADGGIVEWGAGDMTRITRLCVAYDHLQAKWTQVSHKRRWNMRRAGRRIQARIRHLVDDLHRRCARWLCESYRVVLLPTFDTQQMVTRSKRRINSKTARAMLTWSHYRFKMHLLHKAREFPWCRILIVTEEYTSKTCGQCFHVHAKLGGNKRFRCPACGYEADRDASAARNILLKHLSRLSPAATGSLGVVA
jgi:putative transposase